jgi:hypothetical protein
MDGMQNGGETGVDCGGPCPACPTCMDGMQNGGETGVDCGGPCPACQTTCNVGNCNTCGQSACAQSACTAEINACFVNPACVAFNDCVAPCVDSACYSMCELQNPTGYPLWYTAINCIYCSTDTCAQDCTGTCPITPVNQGSTCNDGIQNGNETGVDCGGSCPACPTCTDGVQNGGETGVDCGGPCPTCPTSCDVGDCNTCSQSTCAQNACTAEINACVANPACIAFDNCVGNCMDSACYSMCELQDPTGYPLWYTAINCIYCSTDTCAQDCTGTCPITPINQGSTCNDGIQNGNETGVDCGGSCPACPTCTDGVQNGQETGVDCGGPDCPACATSCDVGDCNTCGQSTCAQSACTAEINACFANPACIAFNNCVGPCMDSACYSMCELQNPTGYPLWYTAINCIYCSTDTCAQDCAGTCPITPQN